MDIFRLTVKEHAGLIINHFTHWDDAKATFETTYSKVPDKPKYTIEKIDVLERATPL